VAHVSVIPPCGSLSGNWAYLFEADTFTVDIRNPQILIYRIHLLDVLHTISGPEFKLLDLLVSISIELLSNPLTHLLSDHLRRLPIANRAHIHLMRGTLSLLPRDIVILRFAFLNNVV